MAGAEARVFGSGLSASGWRRPGRPKGDLISAKTECFWTIIRTA